MCADNVLNRVPGSSRILSLIMSAIVGGLLYLVVILMSHPIKYVFYIFLVSLVGLLYLIGFQYDRISKFNWLLPSTTRFSLSRTRMVDYFLVTSSVVVLISNLFSNVVPYTITLAFSIIVSFFLPGWVLLRLLNLRDVRNPDLSTFVLSFALSIASSASLFESLLTAVATTNSPALAKAMAWITTISVWLAVIYLGVSLIPILRDAIARKVRRKNKPSSILTTDRNGDPTRKASSADADRTKVHYNIYDILILAWISLFFIFIISSLYPGLAYNPDSDIARIFLYSKGLILTANNSFSSNYPWFQFVWGTVMMLSPAVITQISMSFIWIFQSGIAYLSIILIFSFYIMAKAYLDKIDRRAPLIATILFFVFSGFAWSGNSDDVMQLWHVLDLSNKSNSYGVGIGQTPFLWAWFRPLTLGFALFFVLVYLMQRDDIKRTNYIIISSLAVLTLSQSYFPDLVVFVSFLFVIALFFPLVKLRLKEISVSTVIGISASALLQFQQYQTNSPYPSEYYLGLAILAIISFLLSKYTKRLPSKLSIKNNYRIVLPICLSIYFVFFILFWFFQPIVFQNEIYAVPVELYPILLGVIGIIGIAGFAVVLKAYSGEPIMIFPLLFLFVIVFGRVLTYYNSFENTGYWERRLIPYVFVSCSIVGSLAVFKVIDYLRQKNQDSRDSNINANLVGTNIGGRIVNKVTKINGGILSVTFISILVLGGLLSTVFGLQSLIYNMSKYGLTENETSLKSHLDAANPHSTVLTFSPRTESITEFTNVGQIGNVIGSYADQIWPSQYPELPLNVLRTTQGPALIYLNKNDLKPALNEKSYLSSHVVMLAPPFNKTKVGNSGQILQLPRIAPPASNSSTVLVLPQTLSTSYTSVGDCFPRNCAAPITRASIDRYYYYAYDFLSFGGYNFTTAPISDLNSISKATVVIAPSDDIAQQLVQYKGMYNLHFSKLIELNLDGHNQLDLGNVLTKFNHSVEVRVHNSNFTRWIPFGAGLGSVGAPKITYYTIDGDNKTSNSGQVKQESLLLKLDVGPGRYKQWGISPMLKNVALNLSKYDFIKFNWYGLGDGKWYVLQLWSGPGKNFWYRFQDLRKGWTEIVLPTRAADGLGRSVSVPYEKQTKSNSTWSNITAINFRTYISNLNKIGTFYLEGLSFANVEHAYSVATAGKQNINQQQQFNFPTSVELYPIVIPPRSNYTVIANYNTGVPFILENRYPNFDFSYFNVYPIIQRISLASLHHSYNIMETRQFYGLLGNLSNWIVTKARVGLQPYQFSNPTMFNFNSGQVAVFSSANFTGDTNVFSPSSSGSIGTNSGDTIRVNVDGKLITLNGLTQIMPIRYNDLMAKSSQGGGISNRGSYLGNSVPAGSGFYTNVLLYHPVLKFSSHSHAGDIILLAYDNGTTIPLYGKNVEFTGLSKVNLLLREPAIVSNGHIAFSNFNGYGGLSGILPTSGQGLRVDGTVSFNAQSSDNNIVVTNNTSLQGKISYDSALLQKDFSVKHTSITKNLGKTITKVSNQTKTTFSNPWVLDDFSPTHLLMYILLVAAVYLVAKLFATGRIAIISGKRFRSRGRKNNPSG